LPFSSIQVCSHTFLPHLINSNSTVVDLGAHDGDFALAMLEQFHCRIASAEPVQELLDKIPPHPLLTVLPVAVGGKNQSISLNLFSSRCASVMGAVATDERAETYEVEMVTLEEFLRRAGVERVDLLKIDIEGPEIDIFNSCNDAFLKSVAQITVEFHDFIYPEHLPAIKAICSRMRRLGFWVIRFPLKNYADVLFLNRTTGVGAAEVAYLRTMTRLRLGVGRVLARSRG